jgi:hypothetical protein
MPETVTAADIENHLTSHNDFDLELSVYRGLREKGVDAIHGGTYADPVTNKPRQYDVRATALVHGGSFAVTMAIECKSLSTDFPLVVSRVPRDASESYHQVLAANIGGVNSTRVVPSKQLSLLFRPDRYVGKKTSQIGVEIKKDGTRVTTDDDRDTYEKWAQALASAHGLVRQVFTFAHHQQVSELAATFVTAILVIPDGTLWTVDYEANGSRAAPRLADQTTLFVAREYTTPRHETYMISHLQIFTRTGFDRFIDSLCDRSGGRIWAEIFPRELFA